MSIACLGMVLTHTTLMIRIILTKLHLSPISLHSTYSVRIPSSVNNFGICFLPLGYLLLGHLLSGSIIHHLMHSKVAECILMSPSAMQRGVSVFTHLCTKITITSSVNGRQYLIYVIT